MLHVQRYINAVLELCETKQKKLKDIILIESNNYNNKHIYFKSKIVRWGF